MKSINFTEGEIKALVEYYEVELAKTECRLSQIKGLLNKLTPEEELARVSIGIAVPKSEEEKKELSSIPAKKRGRKPKVQISPEAEPTVEDSNKRVRRTKAEIEAAKATGDGTKKRIRRTKAEIEAAKAAGEGTKKRIRRTKAEIEAAKAAGEGTKKRIRRTKAEIEAAKAAGEGTKKRIRRTKAEIEAAKATGEGTKKRIRRTKAEIEAAKATGEGPKKRGRRTKTEAKAAKATGEGAKKRVRRTNAQIKAEKSASIERKRVRRTKAEIEAAKDAIKSARAAISSGIVKGRKSKAGNAPKTDIDWPLFVKTELQNSDQFLTAAALNEKALKSFKISKSEAPKIKNKITNTLNKLSKEKQIVGKRFTKHPGFFYGLNDWFDENEAPIQAYEEKMQRIINSEAEAPARKGRKAKNSTTAKPARTPKQQEADNELKTFIIETFSQSTESLIVENLLDAAREKYEFKATERRRYMTRIKDILTEAVKEGILSKEAIEGSNEYRYSLVKQDA